jgi:hypothetical protein
VSVFVFVFVSAWAAARAATALRSLEAEEAGTAVAGTCDAPPLAAVHDHLLFPVSIKQVNPTRSIRRKPPLLALERERVLGRGRVGQLTPACSVRGGSRSLSSGARSLSRGSSQARTALHIGPRARHHVC